MSATAKIPGTKYTFKLYEDFNKKTWNLSLMIDGKTEDSVEFSNLTMRSVNESVETLISQNSLQINPLQLQIMVENLYKSSSGDTDLSQHKQSIEERQEKQNMMGEDAFRSSIVSEFKDRYNIQESTPKPTTQKQQKPKKVEIDPNVEKAMSSVVSEMHQSFDDKAQPQYASPPPGSLGLSKAQDPVDIRVTGVDIDELISELQETKELLQQDILRVNQRMEKIDRLVAKISSISSRL